MSYQNPMSFLPDDFVKARSNKKKRIIIIAVSIIGGLGLIGGGFFVVKKYVKFDIHSTPSAQTAPAPAPAPSPATYTVESHRIEQAHRLSEEPRPPVAPTMELTTTDLDKVPLSQLLAEVNNALPSGVSLLDLTLESKRVTAPATATTDPDTAPVAPATVEYNVTIQISGIAQNDVQVAQFINRLGKSPVLKNLNLLVSDETAVVDAKGHHFHLEMGLDPSFDMKAGGTASVDPK